METENIFRSLPVMMPCVFGINALAHVCTGKSGRKVTDIPAAVVQPHPNLSRLVMKMHNLLSLHLKGQKKGREGKSHH